MSYIDDFINMVNDIECQKALDHFNASQPIEKGWITTEDGKHLFIGADGALYGGKSAYEAHQNESGSGSSSSSKDSDKSTNEKTKEMMDAIKDNEKATDLVNKLTENGLKFSEAVELAYNKYAEDSGKDSGKDNSEAPKTTEMYTGPSKSFKGAADAKDYFGDAWEKSLTEDETDAVIYYTGSGYLDINPKLRGGDSIDPYSALGNMIQDLDSAIAKSELKEAIEVRRYSGPELFGKSDGGPISFSELEALVGATITDNGFTSTTVLPKGDSSFGNVNMHITVPPGKGRGTYVANISKYEDEQEFLLARGSNFKVTGVKKDANDLIIVEMTVVD